MTPQLDRSAADGPGRDRGPDAAGSLAVVGPAHRRWLPGEAPARLRPACRCFKPSATDRRPRFSPAPRTTARPPCLAARWPEVVRDVRAAADRTLAGRFDLLGYRDLWFGDPVDWHLDPVAGRRAPLVHWSRLDPLDARQRGRQQGRLGAEPAPVAGRAGAGLPAHRGRALRARRSPATCAAGTAPIRWGWGINWASSLEVALRLIAWCWALVLFRGSSRARSGAVPGEMRRRVQAHASPRRAIPLVLLLAEHPPDRRGARPVLRGHAVPRAAAAPALARRAGARSWSASCDARSWPTASTSSSRPATSGTRWRSRCTS